MKPDLSTVNFCFFSLFIFPFYRPSLVLIDDRSSHTPIQGAAIIYIIRGPIQLLRRVGLFFITGLSNAQGVCQAQPFFDLDHSKSSNHPTFHFLFFALTQQRVKNKK